MGFYGHVKTTKLIKIFLKSRSESDKKAYNEHQNKGVSLLRKTKKAILFESERKRPIT